ncbi:hypothetical protein quinque_011605 [Culex quinquefasciatus]
MDNVFQLPKAIIVRRGYPHKEEVGQTFFKVAERGVAQLVAKQVFQALGSEKAKDAAIQEGYLRISVRRLAVTFAVLGVGVVLASVIFTIELVTHYRRQSK